MTATLIGGAPNTLTQVDAALKQLYVDDNEAGLFYDERVAFGVIPKDESFGGRNEPDVVTHTRTGGGSATFSTAQAVSSVRSKKIAAFLMTGVDGYSLIRVPGRTLAYVRNTNMAWESLLASLSQKGLDDAEQNLANRIERQLFRNGNGSIAQVQNSKVGATSLASTTSTLLGYRASGATTAGEATAQDVADATDITKITFVLLNPPEASLLVELDDFLSAASSPDTTAPGAETYQVKYIDNVNGIIGVANQTTTTLPVAGQSGTAHASLSTQGNYLFTLGDDYGTSGAGAAICISGFDAWMPSAVTATDAFFSVNRSVSTRLYGKYVDNSTMSREQALIRFATTLANEGGAPTLGLAHYTAVRALDEELGLRKEIADMNPVSERGLVANISYKGVYVQGPKGPIAIMPSTYCPANRCYMIRPEDWKLLSAGPAMNLEDRDGLVVLRHPTEDSYEGRMVFRGNLECLRPGRQGVVLLQTA